MLLSMATKKSTRRTLANNMNKLTVSTITMATYSVPRTVAVVEAVCGDIASVFK